MRTDMCYFSIEEWGLDLQEINNVLLQLRLNTVPSYAAKGFIRVGKNTRGHNSTEDVYSNPDSIYYCKKITRG